MAKKIVSDPLLVRAIAVHNQSGETAADIKTKDARWMSDTSFPLRAQLTTNECAKRLTELVAADSRIVEAFLMSNQGALVCATKTTSDYWQGDEAKWQKTFGSGAEFFVDEPAQDASTGVFAVQFSVLVRDGGKNAGALTLTMRFRGDEVGVASRDNAP